MDLTALRNFKDFLLLYNEISETCFKRCAGSTINRELSHEEESCVNNCAGKYVNANHRIMGVYVEVQSTLVNKRMNEYNKAAEAAATAAEAAATAVEVEATTTAAAASTNNEVAEAIDTTAKVLTFKQPVEK